MAGLYLFRFAGRASDTENFCEGELEALFWRQGVNVEWVSERELVPPLPYALVRLENGEEAMKKACMGGILVKDVYEVWGVGATHVECAADVSKRSKTLAEAYASHTWRFDIDQYGSSTATAEKNRIRAEYAPSCGWTGKVDLRDPEQRYLAAGYGRAPTPALEASLETPPWPQRVIMGRYLCESKARDLVAKSRLSARVFLGPTAMDNELALVMASHAQCRRGSMVLDPYCGTGSILVACSLLGAAYCLGADIDWKVLRGKAADENDGAVVRKDVDGRRVAGPDALPAFSAAAAEKETQPQDTTKHRKTIFSNFRQYGLPLPDIVRLDAGRYVDHFRAPHERFDAIVTDPPYGIRAGARATGAKDPDLVKPIDESLRADHIPRTKPYPVADVLADLVDIAARALRVDGHLSFLLPATLDFDAARDAPSHPALLLVSCRPQPINSRYARFLVVMRKLRPWNDSTDADPRVRDAIRAQAQVNFDKLKDAIWASFPPSPGSDHRGRFLSAADGKRTSKKKKKKHSNNTSSSSPSSHSQQQQQQHASGETAASDRQHPPHHDDASSAA